MVAVMLGKILSCGLLMIWYCGMYILDLISWCTGQTFGLMFKYRVSRITYRVQRVLSYCQDAGSLSRPSNLWSPDKGHTDKRALFFFQKSLPPPNSIPKSSPQCQKWREAPPNPQWLAALALADLPPPAPCPSLAPLPSPAIPTQGVKNTNGPPCIRDQ